MKNKGFLALIVAALMAAAFMAYRSFKRRSESTDELESDAPVTATGFPVFPVVLLSEVKGLASVTKNLGNLRTTGDSWEGKISEYRGFDAFSDYAYGVRALLKNLVTAYNKHGRKTIQAIISTYAPSNENNTDVYINNVCLWTGKKADQPLTLSDMLILAPAIIRMEVGIPDGLTPYLKDYVNRVNAYFKIV